MSQASPLVATLDRVNPFRNDDAAPLFTDDDLRALAGDPDVQQHLLEIVRRPDQPLARRVAALEALAQGKWMTWTTVAADTRIAAGVLAEAIPVDARHNHWGLPGAYVGRTGKILLAMDPGMVDALRPLLSDQKQLVYLGSEDATMQSLAHYRVADLAAYLLLTHRHEPWVDSPDAEKRDAEIDRLKAKLDSR